MTTGSAPYGLTWPQARIQLEHLGYSDAQIRACSEACPGPGMSHDLPGGLHVAGTDSAGMWYIGGIPARAACRGQEEAFRHLTSQAGGNYTSTEARDALTGAMAIEGGIYRRLAFHDVAYVIEDKPGGRHLGYVIIPKPPHARPDVHDHGEHLDGTVAGCPACCQPPPVSGTAAAEAWALRAYSQVRLSCPEVPEVTPGARDAFYEALEEASVMPRTAAEHELAWLREIRDIAADRLATDAQAGRRIRMLLYPPHLPHDGGTAEGCPGCFPPGEVIGRESSGRPEHPDHPDLGWLLAVIPVVDRHLDDLAPPHYRDNPLANMWRRFSAGPVSEAAEAIDALNGMTGGNPRKGVTHTRTQLLAEAADTAFSALLAIQSQTKDINETWMIFTEAAAKAYSRVPDANRPDRGRQSLADYYAPPGPDGRIAHDNGS